MRNSVWHTANFFSLGNALSGTAAILAVVAGNMDLALRLVALGILFDVFDGPIARWRGPTDGGKMLDRVGDRITMALAPVIILYAWTDYERASIFVGLVIISVTLLRLIRTDASGENMVGLPFFAPGVLIVFGIIAGIPQGVLLFLAACTAVLAISSIPFSFPFALRKPDPSSGQKRAVLFMVLRAAPFAGLVFLQGTLHTLLGSALFFGAIVLFTTGVPYMMYHSGEEDEERDG